MQINEYELYSHIAKALREARKQCQFSQDEVAQALGLTRTSIVNIEAGSQKLPLHRLYAFCRALKLEITDVLPPVDEIATGDPFLPLENQLSDLEQEVARLKRLLRAQNE